MPATATGDKSAFATMSGWICRAHPPRARPRADRPPLAHAGRCRLPGAHRGSASRRSASAARRCSPTASPTCGRGCGDARAARLLRRPHRRRADRAAREVAQRPVRADRARRLAVRPRRGRHEGLARGVRRRDRGVRRARTRRAGLDRSADHVRRGRAGDRRHGEGRRRLERDGEQHRLLRRRRAVVGGRARRHDQERPARLAVREADRQGRCRATSPIRSWRAIPIHLVAPVARRTGRECTGTTATQYFPPTTWQCRTSTPAPARRT